MAPIGTEGVRWGILGTGRIAAIFAADLSLVPEAVLEAVGSRSPERAGRFAARFGAARAHAGYEALAWDPKVDVVYVATPHPFHRRDATLCLEAGKAVLCEKPLAVDAEGVRAMIAAARTRGRLLVEAMWPRFLPVWTKVREWLAGGALGEVRMLQCDFGHRGDPDSRGRLLAPELGGGALLDVGVYPLSLASTVFGRAPTKVAALAHLGDTGVDEQAAMILGYDRGELAVLSCAVRTRTPREATILGTRGHIRVHAPCWAGRRVTLSAEDRTETLDLPFPGDRFVGLVTEVMRCLGEGRLESEVIPLDESLAVLETLERIRSGWEVPVRGPDGEGAIRLPATASVPASPSTPR